jgi:small subunit ribosomal protein S2
MRPYIYGERDGTHIIDLEKTKRELQKACEYLQKAAVQKKNIVFVGSKKQAADAVEYEARRCGVNYVSRRWVGGLITNFETVRERLSRLRELEDMRTSDEFYYRPKSELAALNRELFKLEKAFGGLKDLHGRPEVLYIIDQRREDIAVREARKSGATVIGIVDTNCDPDCIDYVIPGNDDSLRSIRLITSALADAILGDEPDQPSDPDIEPPESSGPDLHPSGVRKRPYPTRDNSEISLPLPELDKYE